MPVHILTIPFDPEKEIFLDEDLAKFLLNKRVKELRPEFFQMNGKAYWTVFVEYEQILEKASGKEEEGLDEPQRILFQRLKGWRKDRAEKEGVPVYIVGTNKQFSDIVRAAPVSLEGLKNIRGFGKGKVSKYGKEIVEIVKAFYEKP